MLRYSKNEEKLMSATRLSTIPIEKYYSVRISTLPNAFLRKPIDEGAPRSGLAYGRGMQES